MSDQDEPVKIRVGMAVSYIHSSSREDVMDAPCTRAEWAAMTEEQRQRILDEVAQDYASNYLDMWAFAVTGDDG